MVSDHNTVTEEAMTGWDGTYLRDSLYNGALEGPKVLSSQQVVTHFGRSERV